MTRRHGETEMQYKSRLERERRDRDAVARNSQIQRNQNDPLNPGNLASPLNPILQDYSNPPTEWTRSEPSPSPSESSSTSFSSTDNSGASSFGD